VRQLASLGADAFGAVVVGHAAAINIRDKRLGNEAVSKAFPELPKW